MCYRGQKLSRGLVSKPFSHFVKVVSRCTPHRHSYTVVIAELLSWYGAWCRLCWWYCSSRGGAKSRLWSLPLKTEYELESWSVFQSACCVLVSAWCPILVRRRCWAIAQLPVLEVIMFPWSPPMLTVTLPTFRVTPFPDVVDVDAKFGELPSCCIMCTVWLRAQM